MDDVLPLYHVVHLCVDVEPAQARNSDIQVRKKNLDLEVQHQENDVGLEYHPLCIRSVMRGVDTET